jgi:hypothetical protein
VAPFGSSDLSFAKKGRYKGHRLCPSTRFIGDVPPSKYRRCVTMAPQQLHTEIHDLLFDVGRLDFFRDPREIYLTSKISCVLRTSVDGKSRDKNKQECA